jgi:hypothetical protein
VAEVVEDEAAEDELLRMRLLRMRLLTLRLLWMRFVDEVGEVEAGVVEDEVVEVLGFASDETGSVYAVAYKNEFGEKNIVQFQHDEFVSLYVYVDSDE